MPRTRPQYPEEFRREAIRLARLGDQPQRKLAESLGISDVTLRNWLKEETASWGERPGGFSGDEREEFGRALVVIAAEQHACRLTPKRVELPDAIAQAINADGLVRVEPAGGTIWKLTPTLASESRSATAGTCVRSRGWRSHG